jgi:prolyl-tRNA editing enzyme YbaK/EbsC (Cys-tRNA(Pro) deacylase)
MRTSGRFGAMDELRNRAIQRVVRVAERKGVALRIVSVHGAARTAEEAAASVGADLGAIVKSIVFVAPRPDGRLVPIVCLVSGRNQVDTARLAAVVGESSVRRASPREARLLTGFSVGGIPPVGFGRDVRVVMDPDLDRHQVVWAAAGTDDAVFAVAPATLRALANAFVAPIAPEPWLGAVGVPALESQLQAG